MDQQGFGQNPENTSGPQFDLNETGGWGQRLREWLGKYGSSVILPIIALAILASGIYLYATQKQQQANIILDETPETTVLSSEEKIVGPEIVIREEPAVETDQQIINNLAVNPSPEMPEQVEQIVPERTTTEKSRIMVVRAIQGEGVTHLARKAVKNYLQNNQQAQSLNLTKEHKIYVEDYIKDRIGSKTLTVNEEVEISENLIDEAINSATKLTPEQLKVIEQFSALVVSEI